MDFDPDKIEVVVNRYKKDGPMDIPGLEGVLQKKIFARIGNDYPLFERMTAKGELLCTGAEKHRISREFKRYGRRAERHSSRPFRIF